MINRRVMIENNNKTLLSVFMPVQPSCVVVGDRDEIENKKLSTTMAALSPYTNSKYANFYLNSYQIVTSHFTNANRVIFV